MKQLVIFDWDGVIADSAPFYLDVYRRICAHFGKSFPLRTLEEFTDWYDSAWENNFIDLGFPREAIPEVLAYEETLVDYSSIGIFPGIRETLAELRRDFHVAVASTTVSRFICDKAAAEGLADVFELVAGGEDGLSDKRNKIARVLGHFGIAREQAVMVGDTVMDIVSARARGIPTGAVTDGWNSRRKLEAAGPDLVVAKPAEVAPAVRSLLAGASSGGRRRHGTPRKARP